MKRQPVYDPKNLEDCVVSAGGPTSAETAIQLGRRIERAILIGVRYTPPAMPNEPVLPKGRLKKGLR